MHLNDDSQKALESLIDGNNRFVNGLRNVNSIATTEKLKTLAQKGQKPYCIVLACSDSRVPAEIVFDQGLGDLFVIRVAGNVVAPSLIASMEFAALNFNCSLILVLGHTKCGAIQAACSHHHNPQAALSKNLDDLINRITPAVDSCKEWSENDQNFVNKSTLANVRNSAHEITHHSPILASLVKEKKLGIVGAVFELDSGRVLFDINQFDSLPKTTQAKIRENMASL